MLALDLFAGTGWGVACQRLGIEELGVELMPAAIATRDAAGMSTILQDVWTGLPHDVATSEPWGYDLLIASPPCQTFSQAGGGSGRRALDEVLDLLNSGAYLHPDHLRAFGERHDPRTALVLTPLTYVARDLPRFVVLEQVPPVLPVWEAMAVQLRANGYSIWTGVLNAEQYGVPQTRKRAVLIARADGVEAGPPTPTHSRYYSP
jgi:DNA (cytosine-5)-methyltransferase 1